MLVSLVVLLLTRRLTYLSDNHSQGHNSLKHTHTHPGFFLPSDTKADPESVWVEIVIVVAECDDKPEDGVQEGEEEEEEGRTLCSCVFSLITSSYDGGG